MSKKLLSNEGIRGAVLKTASAGKGNPLARENNFIRANG